MSEKSEETIKENVSIQESDTISPDSSIPYLLSQVPDQKPSKPNGNVQLPRIASTRPVLQHQSSTLQDPQTSASHLFRAVGTIHLMASEIVNTSSSPSIDIRTHEGSSQGVSYIHLIKCKWSGILITIYYLGTIFCQPIGFGIFGVITGLLGVLGTRNPISLRNGVFVRIYIWLNYVAMMLNLARVLIVIVFRNMPQANQNTSIPVGINVNTPTHIPTSPGITNELDTIGPFVIVLLGGALIVQAIGLYCGQLFFTEILRNGAMVLQP